MIVPISLHITNTYCLWIHCNMQNMISNYLLCKVEISCFFMNLLWNQYNNIARNELNNYTNLTFLLVQPWFGPYAGTTVHNWLVFLTTVLNVLIRADFPDPLYPITRRLRAWLCSGISISTIPSKSWFFFFNWRRKNVFQSH